MSFWVAWVGCESQGGAEAILGHEMPPRRTQDAPRRPKTPPRRPQDDPKTPQDAPRTAQDAPRRPKTSQDLSKTLPSHPKPPPDNDFGTILKSLWKNFGKFFGQTLPSDLPPRITSKQVPSHPQSPSGNDFGTIYTRLWNIFGEDFCICWTSLSKQFIYEIRCTISKGTL